MSSRFVIIMAGGRGERFWPKSRLARPKHLQPIVGETTMLAQTIDRVAELVPAENLIVITNAAQRAIVLEDSPQLAPEQVIGEPVGRDTAAAVGLATLLVQQKDPNATYAILPADHVIHNSKGYRAVIEKAFQAAETSDSLVTIGIKPTEPATGYGYIHIAGTEREVSGAPVYSVKEFVEKPDLETAKSYVKSGEFFWNAGMFIWKASAIDAALKSFTPGLHSGLQQIAAGLADGKSVESLLGELYADLEKISIDFAVMEKATNVAMLESDFDWDDVGAWPAIERHFPKDNSGNVKNGTVIFEQSSNNIAVSDGKHLVSLIGVDDLIVVHTGDATLVCHKDKAQEIKKVVKELGDSADFKHLI